jgi:hypothetical protein
VRAVDYRRLEGGLGNVHESIVAGVPWLAWGLRQPQPRSSTPFSGRGCTSRWRSPERARQSCCCTG